MKLRKMNYKQDGETRQSEKWYAVWMDHSETLRRLPLFADQKASNEIARKIDRLNSVNSHFKCRHPLSNQMPPLLVTV